MKIELPKFVPKGWGWESWLANNELYCGKILYVHRSKMCSYHYHKKKDETFYLLDGRIKLWYCHPSTYTLQSRVDKIDHGVQIVMEPGDCFRLPPLTRHRFKGLADSHIIEISTHHEEEDSYRLVDGDSQKGD